MACVTTVSAVIPLYNKAESIERAIDSVLSQQRPPDEILVADDGSTDDSVARVLRYGDPRVRVLQQANAGPSAARNLAIRAATGDWIALLDADDAWSPNHLSDLLGPAISSDVILVFSNTLVESLDLRPSISQEFGDRRISDYFSFALEGNGYPVATGSVLIRRSALLAAGLFDPQENFGEDVDMWCRLALQGAFFYVSQPSSTYFDLGSPTRGAVNRGRLRMPPFARKLPDLVARNGVPAHVLPGARRYANFLLLEYARQLIDAGERRSARKVLLEDCVMQFDPARYLRRLIRTTVLGERMFRMFRRVPNDREGPVVT